MKLFKLSFMLFVFLFYFHSLLIAKDNDHGRMGIFVEIKYGLPVVSYVIENSPASQSDVRVGDFILKIDDHDLKNTSSSDLSKKIEYFGGSIGGKKTLLIKRLNEDDLINKDIFLSDISDESMNKYYNIFLNEIKEKGRIFNTDYDSVWRVALRWLAKNGHKIEISDKDAGIIQTEQTYVYKDLKKIVMSEKEPISKPVFDVKDYIDELSIHPKRKLMGMSAIWYYARQSIYVSINRLSDGDILVKPVFTIDAFNNLDGMVNCNSKGVFELGFLSAIQSELFPAPLPLNEKTMIEPDNDSSCWDLCKNIKDSEFKKCMSKCNNSD